MIQSDPELAGSMSSAIVVGRPHKLIYACAGSVFMARLSSPGGLRFLSEPFKGAFYATINADWIYGPLFARVKWIA